MKRVVITGTGIVSCIGNDAATVTTALRESKSGIRAMPQFTELGMRSQVAGVPQIDLEALIGGREFVNQPDIMQGGGDKGEFFVELLPRLAHREAAKNIDAQAVVAKMAGLFADH